MPLDSMDALLDLDHRALDHAEPSPAALAAAAERPLRILIYGLNFAPELTGIGRYTGDMAAWLAEQGHEVTVVTAYPYYPEWRLAKGCPAWRWSMEDWQGVRVVRCPLWVPRRPSTARRLVHLLSFMLASGPVALGTALVRRPDILFTVEPSSFGAPWALLAAKLSGARSWLHVQDIEIGAATALGMVRGRRVQRLVQAVYGRMLGSFDEVSTISHTMRRELERLGRAPGTVRYFPNWVDADRVHPLAGENRLRRELGLNDDRIVCLYSGNMGEKQGVESLAEAARLLRDRRDIHFVLCGAGAARERIAAMVADLPNVTLLPVQPEERLNELLNLADIHLLPQRGDTTGFAMPSKLLNMLASGRAILAQAEPDSELIQLLAGAQAHAAPGDAAGTAAQIVRLAEDRALRASLAAQSRALASTLARRHVLQTLNTQLRASMVTAAAVAADVAGKRYS